VSSFGIPAGWWEEPRYVETGGELVFRQPFVAEGVRMYSFVLEADTARLDRYLERSFNEPLRERFGYRSIGRHVLLNFVSTRKLSAGRPDEFGFLDELEVAIWILAEDHNDKGLDPVWSVPYMFVASPAPLATGREVYGFPKQFGHIDIPDDRDHAPERMCLSGPALTAFDPAGVVEDKEIIRVERDGLPEKLVPIWDSGPGPDQFTLGKALAQRRGHRLDVLKTTLAEWRILAALGDQLLRRTVPIVLLKQFRSVVDADRACYQAVVGVDLKMTAFRKLGLLPDDYAVTLTKLANEPFARELGLALDSKPKTAFWLDFDFTIGGATSVAKLDIR